MMKIIVLAAILLNLQGCFVLTRSVVTVNTYTADKALAIQYGDDVWVSNTAFYPDEKHNTWKMINRDDEWQLFYRITEVERDKYIETTALIEEKGSRGSVDITRNHIGYSKNPLRYLATPFTLTADIVLDIVTLGYPMMYLWNYQTHRERHGTMIRVDKK